MTDTFNKISYILNMIKTVWPVILGFFAISAGIGGVVTQSVFDRNDLKEMSQTIKSLEKTMMTVSHNFDVTNVRIDGDIRNLATSVQGLDKRLSELEKESNILKVDVGRLKEKTYKVP